MNVTQIQVNLYLNVIAQISNFGMTRVTLTVNLTVIILNCCILLILPFALHFHALYMDFIESTIQLITQGNLKAVNTV